MIRDLLGSIWVNIPKTLRRWSMRATNTRFTVTAAAVVCNPERQVLLLKHLFRPGSGWGLPGGFMKSGEQPQEALRRELREEIGLEVERLEIFSARTFRKPRQIEIIFLGQSNGQPQPKSIEIEQVGWFATSLLPEGLPNDQRRLIKRALMNGAIQGD